MMQLSSFYRRPLFLSIVLHIIVFAALLWHFNFNEHTPLLGKPSQVNIINATVVTDAQQKKPQRSPAATKPAPAKSESVKAMSAEIPPTKELTPPKPPEPLSIPKPEVKPVKPVQKTIDKPLEPPKKVIEQKPVVDTQKLDFEKAMQKQQAAELAAEKAKAEKEKKKVQAEKLAKQKAAEKQMKAAEEKALQQQLAQEEQSLAAASAESTEQIKSELDKYKALIVQAIAQNWLVPTGVDRSLSCELLIQVGPGGAVLNVQVVQSSGDSGLDNSARTAVYKASPLPAPEDPDLFEHFRQLRLRVKPENLVDG